MNRRVINQILKNKFNDWLKSIDDKELREDVKKNSIITGGCIASMLMNEKVNDFDIYFTNKDTVKKVAEYYVKKFNESNKKPNRFGYTHQAFVLDGEFPDIIPDHFKNQGSHKSHMVTNITSERIKIIIRSDGVGGEVEDQEVVEAEKSLNYDDMVEGGDTVPEELMDEKKEKEKYQVKYLSTNAITLTDKVQLIVRFYGPASEIHSNFDFVHCTNYWVSCDEEVCLNQEALESILTKQLRYVGSKYPICSVIRTRKFLKRGWSINAGQYLKMVYQISDLDLTNINVLEDQLIGVDTAYFMCLIEQLKSQMTEENQALDKSYVVTLIDKIF